VVTARPAAPLRANGLASSGQPSHGPGCVVAATSSATANTAAPTATGRQRGLRRCPVGNSSRSTSGPTKSGMVTPHVANHAMTPAAGSSPPP